MNLKKALLAIPLLALSVTPTLQARDHSEHEWRERSEKAARWRARHGYYNNGNYNNGYYNGNYNNGYYNNGYRYYGNNPYYNDGYGSRSRAMQQMDRNHDGVITPREREHFYKKYGYMP